MQGNAIYAARDHGTQNSHHPPCDLYFPLTFLLAFILHRGKYIILRG
jgi:hypothetical protein